jgi:hypothetical protein
MIDTCSSWSSEPGMLLDRWHPSDIGGDVFLAAKRDEIRAKRLLGLWFDSPLLATILATGGISIFGDSSL